LSKRQHYLAALREAAQHVVAHVLAPEFERRHPVESPRAGGISPPLLSHPSDDAHLRVEVLSRFAGVAAVFLGARARSDDDAGDVAAARTLLHELGDEAREDTYRSEAEGFVRAHFLTVRALALQLLAAGSIDAEEAGLIIDVAEGQCPRRVLDAYRAARIGRTAT
jgi:hypothetical protein